MPRHTRKRTPRWSSSPGLVPSSKWPCPAAESGREGGCPLRCLLLTGQSAKCPPRAPRRLRRRLDKRTCSCVPRVCRSAGSRGASAAGLALGAVHERRRWQKSRRRLSPVKLLAVLEERPARRGHVLTRPLLPATPPVPPAKPSSDFTQTDCWSSPLGSPRCLLPRHVHKTMARCKGSAEDENG